MRLGFDFDNVIADGHSVKLAIAKEVLGRDVKYDELFKGLENTLLHEAIYYNKEANTRMAPVTDAIGTLLRLQQDGHNMRIGTGRTEKSTQYARQWLEDHNVLIPIIGTSDRPKTEACEGLDMFFDDNMSFLLPLRGTVKELFLFTRPYNLLEDTQGMRRVSSWNDIYAEVRYGKRK